MGLINKIIVLMFVVFMVTVNVVLPVSATGPPANITVSANPSVLTVNDTSSITARVTNATGYTVNDTNVTFWASGSGKFTDTSTNTTTQSTGSDGNVTVSLEYSSMTPGIVTVMASDTNNSLINATDTVCFQCDGSASNIYLSVTPSICRADNDHIPLILAKVTDFCGNPIYDQWVDFKFNDSLPIYSYKTNSSGYVRFNISGSATLGTHNITATVNGTTITETETITFHPVNHNLAVNPAPPVLAYLNYGDATVTKNGTIYLRLSYPDVYGTWYAVPYTQITVTTTDGTIDNGTVNGTSVTTTTDIGGYAQVNFTSFTGDLNTSTNVTITANANLNSSFEPTVNGSSLIVVKGSPFLEITTTYDPESFSEDDLPAILNVTHTIVGRGELGKAKPLDVIFVMDSSGSMDWNDPSDLRIDAAKNFVGKMNETDRGGVVDFDEDAVLINPLTFTDSTGKNSLNTSLDTIDHSGNTAIYDGMHVATDEYTYTLLNQYNLSNLLSGVTNTSLEANVTGIYALSAESPHNYPNNYDNTWTIQPEPGASAIRLNFTVNLNSGDYLYFYNANNESLGRCTSQWANNTQYSAWVQGDTIRMRLVTGSSGTDWGFKTYYAEVADNVPMESSHGRETTPFLDSGYYDGYMRDANYYTNLTIPGASAIRIKFRENLDYENDTIYFYDGSDNPLGWIDWNWQSTSSYTEMMASPWAEGDTIKVRFASGDTLQETDYGFKGYYVEYLTTGVPIESMHGFESSPLNDTTRGYGHNTDYNLTLQVPGAEYIRAHISEYNLDDDYFYMYDQNGTVLPEVNGWYYDHDGISYWTPWVTGDTLLTRLVSDNNNDTDYGFRIGDWETGTRNNTRDSVRIEVLLTDGETNSDDYLPADEIQRAIDNNIKVYTIGLGSSVDVAELQNIADTTDGKYYFAVNATALDPIFDEIFLDVQAIAGGLDIEVHLGYENATAHIPRGAYIENSTNMSFSDYNETSYGVEVTNCSTDVGLDCSPTIYNATDYQQLQFNVNKSIGVNDTFVITYQLWVNSTGDIIIGGDVSNTGETLVPGIGSGFSVYSTDPPNPGAVDSRPVVDLKEKDGKWTTGGINPHFVVNVGEIITFDGSESWDDLGIVNYTWIITNGTGAELVNVTDLNMTYPYSSFNNPAEDYTINLTVWDKLNQYDTVSKTLKVTNSCEFSLSANPTKVFVGGIGGTNISRLTATLTNGTPPLTPIESVSINFSQPAGLFGILVPEVNDTDVNGETSVQFTGTTAGEVILMAETEGSPIDQPWFEADDGFFYEYKNDAITMKVFSIGRITLS